MVNNQARVVLTANGVGTTVATASAILNVAAATIPIHTGPVGRRWIFAVLIHRHSTMPIALIAMKAPSALPNVPQNVTGFGMPIPRAASCRRRSSARPGCRSR